MTVYYVDSLTGSDTNTGTSETSALASLAVASKLTLHAGDSVLLAAGSTFDGQLTIKASGTVDNPITFGSYGDGEAPIITGGQQGITGSNQSNIVIENIDITHTVSNAIYAGNATNWLLSNVSVTDTGSDSVGGSVSFQNSRNITVEDSTIIGTHGDGIWMKGNDNVTIRDSVVLNSVGPNADAIQINDSSNITISGNVLDMTGETGSNKGVLVLARAINATVEDNTLTGGGFGASLIGTNIAVHDNDISDFHGYTWSYGIGLGDTANAINYDISGNYIHDGTWGVAVTAAGNPDIVREGIEISDNVFDELTGAALKVDRPATGTFEDNTIDTGTKVAYISSAVTASGTFTVEDNVQTNVPDDQTAGSSAASSAEARIADVATDDATISSLAVSDSVTTTDISGAVAAQDSDLSASSTTVAVQAELQSLAKSEAAGDSVSASMLDNLTKADHFAFAEIHASTPVAGSQDGATHFMSDHIDSLAEAPSEAANVEHLDGSRLGLDNHWHYDALEHAKASDVPFGDV